MKQFTLYKPYKLYKLLTADTLYTLLFYLSILFFIIGFNFSDNRAGGWTQQFMPNLNNEPISDVFFLDSLTGWAVTGDGNPYDSNYILKTTNGGDNWNIKYTDYRDFFRIKFINQNTGFVCGGFNVIGGGLFKSTNGGENWFQMNSPSNIEFRDMSILSNDTIWLVDDDGLEGGVFRTTNGGNSWEVQYQNPSNRPIRIYMYNRNIGFFGTNFKLFKTTNSGLNWTEIIGENGFRDMYFIDSLMGWKANISMNDTNMLKTTDGGISWIKQRLPSGGNITTASGMNKFKSINGDTVFGTGGALSFPSIGLRGFIYTTTNGGNNWLFQLPDTSFGIPVFFTVDFVNRNIGWSYTNYFSSIVGGLVYTGIHTTTGGDTLFFTGVKKSENNKTPSHFSLAQNFPNPFNPTTTIRFSVSGVSNVSLKVYDIAGRHLITLVSGEYRAGEHEAVFNGSGYSSGVYLYRIIIQTKGGKEVYGETKKMLLIK